MIDQDAAHAHPPALATADRTTGAIPPEARVERRSGVTRQLTITGTQLLVIAVLLGVWQIVSDAKLIDPFFISSPSRVASRLWEMLQTHQLYQDTWVTFQEAGKGYVLGVVLGVLLGLLLGLSAMLSAIFLPIFNLLNTMPRVAMAPLFVLWFGIGQTAKVWLVFSVIIIILLFNTQSATQTVDPDIRQNALLLGATQWQLIRKVIIPWCLPWILTGMRVGLAWAIGSAVVGEYLAAREGLGYRIFYYSNQLDQAGLLAGSVVLVVISGLLFAGLGFIEKRLLRWRPVGGAF